MVVCALVLGLGYAAGLNVAHLMTTYLLVMALVAGSSLAGASMIYWSSRLGARPLLAHLSRRAAIGGRLEQVESWLQRDGARAVLAARMTPGLLTATSIVAGALKVPYSRFCLYVATSAVVWTSVLFAVGLAAGAGAGTIQPASPGGAAALLLPLLGLAALLLIAAGGRRISKLLARASRTVRHRSRPRRLT
jgi:membrane protein DedA with SNARE-associated domain